MPYLLNHSQLHPNLQQVHLVQLLIQYNIYSETITSTDFSTGYEYTVTGVGVSMGDSASITPHANKY